MTNKPNTKFELDVNDIRLIEDALRSRLTLNQLGDPEIAQHERSKINKLLGKIHNQKNWYRPKGTYVGG